MPARPRSGMRHRRSSGGRRGSWRPARREPACARRTWPWTNAAGPRCWRSPGRCRPSSTAPSRRHVGLAARQRRWSSWPGGPPPGVRPVLGDHCIVGRGPEGSRQAGSGDSNSTAPSCVARGQEATGRLSCGFFDPLVTASVHGCPSLPPPLRIRRGPGLPPPRQALRSLRRGRLRRSGPLLLTVCSARGWGPRSRAAPSETR